MQVRKTATIAIYHAHGTGNLVASISHRGKVQKIIEHEKHETQAFSLAYTAKMWAAANGFARAIVI